VRQVFDYVDDIEKQIETLSHEIWSYPELGLQEEKSASLYRRIFEDHGFLVHSVEGLPTSLVAEYGQGKPILGFVGEYDALPGLSQEVSASKQPIEEGGPGHGCGHNLLGSASLGAALAVGRYLKTVNQPGTIRFYGCPAEELGVGKIKMDEAGVFDDLDACLAWHPGMWNAVTGSSLSALIKAEFFFEGTTSHAGAHPELGRSALDGVELMNVGANYLREHIPEGTKLHYIITNGGQAANIVPGHASVQYMVRAPKKDVAHEVFARLVKVARGAAMMTETSVDFAMEKDNYDTKNNVVLEDFVSSSYAFCGPLDFDQEDLALAQAIVDTLPPENYREALKVFDNPAGTVLDGMVHSILGRGETFGASSDLGQITYRTPTVQCSATCFPLGVPLHTWQATACAGSTFGLKGAIYMAKVLAVSAVRLFEDETNVLEKAWKEFKANHSR